MKRFLRVSIYFSCLLAGSAQATSMIGSTSVTASVPDLSSTFSIQNLINQAGLSANYVSGVTDFASFTSTTTHSNPSLGNNEGWASTTGNSFPVNIDFDLGGIFDITSLALWNDYDSQGLGAFEVFSSVDNSFTSLTSLGSFNGVIAPVPVPAAVFDIGDATTQFLRITGSPVSDVNGLLNIGEIAFGGEQQSSPVPEPTTMLLFGTGLAGLAAAGRKRNK